MERFFERIFERPAARLLAPRLEAVHLQRHLERAMESGRSRRAAKWHVPSRYRLLLNTADLVALSGREALPAELGETLRDHARRRGYVLDARPSVRLEASPRVAAGDVVVLTDDMPGGATVGDGPAGIPVAAPVTAGHSSTDGPREHTLDAAAAAPPAERADGEASDAAISPASGSSTSVYRAAQPAAPRARIAVRLADGRSAQFPVDGRTLRVGRAGDNDIVLPDGRVSRHHGQIGVRLGTLVYTDLGSTNGSFLHGNRVREIALGPHDVIQLGGSTLTIEPAAD